MRRLQLLRFDHAATIRRPTLFIIIIIIIVYYAAEACLLLH